MLKKIPQNNHHLIKSNPRLWGEGGGTVPYQTNHGEGPVAWGSLRKLRPMRKLQLAAKVSVAAEAKAPCTKPPVVAAGGNQGATKRGVFSEKPKWKDIQNTRGVKMGEILCIYGEAFWSIKNTRGYIFWRNNRHFIIDQRQHRLESTFWAHPLCGAFHLHLLGFAKSNKIITEKVLNVPAAMVPSCKLWKKSP